MGKRHVSMDKVISNAWGSTVRLLFKPFAIDRWLLLGFCCWMLMLAGDMGTVIEIVGRSFLPVETMTEGNIKELVEEFKDEFVDSDGEFDTEAGWTVLNHVMNGKEGSFYSRVIGAFPDNPLIGAMFNYWIALVSASLLLGVAAYYLRCRFEFVFLENLLRHRGNIPQPWREFRQEGNSYFLGTLIFFGAVGAINMALTCVTGSVLYSWLANCAANRVFLPLEDTQLYLLFIFGAIQILFTVVCSFYSWFFFYLLVPIMHRERIGVLAGFRKMNALLLRRFWVCLLFWLVMMVCLFGAMLIALVLGVLTCTIFLILLGVPYVRAVLALPLWVFLRSCGLELLQELDPVESPQTTLSKELDA